MVRIDEQERTHFYLNETFSQAEQPRTKMPYSRVFFCSGTTKLKPHHGNRHSHAHMQDHRHHVTGTSQHESEACPAKKFGCQHYCARIADGGYRCMCHRGFKLQWDGRRCEGEQLRSLTRKFKKYILLTFIRRHV